MSKFSPKRYVSRVESIDLEELWNSGKRMIMLDRDNTLVPRDRTTAPESVALWLERARQIGFDLYIVSNNWHQDQVERSARELGIEHKICFACKPLPFALHHAIKAVGSRPEDAVLIGDQLYTDVWAANFAGVDSILVKPQTHVDLWYTHIFRIFERAALKDLPCED